MIQPGNPEVAETDKFYFGVANEIAKAISDSNLVKKYGEQIGKDVVLGCIGYYQDIVADA